MPPSTDIAALHAAIKAKLTAAFPDCHVGFYERHADKLPKLPAIHFHLVEIDPNDPSDDGDMHFEAVLRFAAYVTVSYRKESAKLAVRVLAANVMRVLRAERFGQFVGPAKLGTAGPDEWSPAEDGFETYRIPWLHEARFAALTADEPLPPVPTELWVSTAPDTGAANVGRYKRVSDA